MAIGFLQYSDIATNARKLFVHSWQ